MGTRFILHIMLLLGEFDTEHDLYLHRSLRESLRYCKLIGSSSCHLDLEKYQIVHLLYISRSKFNFVQMVTLLQILGSLIFSSTILSYMIAFLILICRQKCCKLI